MRAPPAPVKGGSGGNSAAHSPLASAAPPFSAAPHRVRWPRARPSSSPRTALIMLAAVFAAGLLVGRGGGRQAGTAGRASSSSSAPPLAAARRLPTSSSPSFSLPPAPTLVTYVFAPTDPAAASNLRFFVDHALWGGALGSDLVAAAEKEEEKKKGRGGGRTSSPPSAPPPSPSSSFFYDDGADYAFIVQGGEEALATAPPAVATLARAVLARAAVHPRAKVLGRRNACYDWGAWGWALRPLTDGGAGLMRPHHRFFLLVNASVRGPFVPPSAHAAATAALRAVSGRLTARAVVPWHALLTALLGGPGRVRLAGPVISCEGTPVGGDAAGKGWLHSPHVQSWALATDRAGLAAWEAAGPAHNPLVCHGDRWAAVEKGEVGASRVLLRAGFGLASLLPRYARVDWRANSNSDLNNGLNGTVSASAWCNQRAPPTGDGRFDGTTLPPSETLFVKHKAADAAAAEENGEGAGGRPWLSATARAAAKASTWADAAVEDAAATADVASNEWVAGLAAHRAPGVGGLGAAVGPACFDATFYTSAHADLASLASDPTAAWSHALHYGQFEGRAIRVGCMAGEQGGPPLAPALLAARDAAHGAGQVALEGDRRGVRVAWVGEEEGEEGEEVLLLLQGAAPAGRRAGPVD